MATSSAPTLADIGKIVDAVRNGDRVQGELATGGTLQVDGARPYLCVHRSRRGSEDVGTAALLSSLASSLRIVDSSDQNRDLVDLIDRIIQALVEGHGAALLIEIWAAESKAGSSSEGPPEPQRLRVFAPEHDAPTRFLERLELATLATQWPGGCPAIEVVYQNDVHQPGFDPLPLQAAGRDSDRMAIGLELTANFRASPAGPVYPEVLRESREALSHVLKQAVYAFAHERTNRRPLHYHELGPGAVSERVWEVDRALTSVSDAFDLLLLVTPVNATAEWLVFRESGFERMPEFHYRPLTMNPSTLKRELFRIPVDEVDDPALHRIFNDKRMELERQLSLLSDRGGPEFHLGSLQIFGRADEALIDLANSVLESVDSDAVRPETVDTIGSERLASHARAELDYYRQLDPNFELGVEVRDDITGILVSRGTTLIGRDALVSSSRLNAALQHEIGIHALTYHNGSRQPMQLLHGGMAGYEELQEGLAVLAELLVGELTAGRLQQLGARVIAAHVVETGADFIETFRILHRDWGVAARAAYTTSMRAFRGGGYAKDSIYLRGFQRVWAYLAEGRQIESLLIGKVTLDQIETVQELRWRGLLEPARLLPRFLDQPEAKARLESLRTGPPLSDQIREGLA